MPQPRSPVVIPLSLLLPRKTSCTLVHHTVPFIQCIRQFSFTPTPRVATIKKSRFRRDKIESEAKKLSDIPSDLGFLDTIIPPTRKGSPGYYPLIWKEPKRWFRFQQLRFVVSYNNRTQKKQFAVNHPKYELNTKDLEKLGLVLYKQMNTSFAAGNDPKEVATLRKICAKGFADSMIASAEARGEGSKITWKWEKTLSKPKLISFVNVPIIQGQPESELVQAVIRIHGRETVCNGDSEPITQDSYSYIILHNKMWIRPANWHIIGRVSEASEERVQAVIDKMKAEARQRKDVRKMTPDGIFKRVYKGILAFVNPGRSMGSMGSSGGRIQPPPPTQPNTGKQ